MLGTAGSVLLVAVVDSSAGWIHIEVSPPARWGYFSLSCYSLSAIFFVELRVSFKHNFSVMTSPIVLGSGKFG